MSLIATNAPGSDRRMHRVENGGFVVTIATDARHLEPRYGPRFDRTATVTSVRFHGREFLDERGMPDEFGLNGNGVLGYEEAAVGSGEFLKIGVGVLQRDSAAAYTFVRHWPVAADIPVETDFQERSLTVIQESPARQGYAYRYQKRYVITRPGQLRIEYVLTNRGDRQFSFEQYNHNFLCFSGARADAEYAVATRFAFDPPGNDKWRWIGGTGRLLAPAPERGGAVFGVDLLAPSRDNVVEITHANGQRVVISGDFPITRFAVWSTQPVVCPEIFHRATLTPGQSVQWSREYIFSTPEAVAASTP